ncbi:MAG: DUF4123 domain-containing protein [Pyrinomonadaceae bacterium]|nr:DUF4123 domain-containing protein [Pyrinomonadaceae bacterium]
MREKLEKYLFEESPKSYAVLDGASVEDLPFRVYEKRARAVCLYRGEIAPDIAEVAPYLIELSPSDAFTDWLLDQEMEGKHFGIFTRSRHSLTEVRKHFRKFLTVYDDHGNPMLFRFYDPRVLTKFLPTCDRTNLNALFAGVSSYFAEINESKFMRFEVENGKLNTTEV